VTTKRVEVIALIAVSVIALFGVFAPMLTVVCAAMFHLFDTLLGEFLFEAHIMLVAVPSRASAVEVV
jgi:hypothetical protein